MKKIIIEISVAILTCAFSFNALGQATAQISGTARDQSGAVLPGVEIRATQAETGITRTTVTNETGSYVLPNLAIGPYKVEASLTAARISSLKACGHASNEGRFTNT